MQIRITVILLSIIAFSGTATAAESFVHPGLLHTREHLAFTKTKVENGEMPWKAAWDSLRARRTSPLDFEPDPVAHVVRGPYGKPSIGDRELSSSARAAYSNALQWAITGDRAHADKAIEILNAWSGRLWTFQDNDAKLLAAWTGDDFCNAAEILRYTDVGWKEKDVAQFERMLRTVYHPLLKGFFPEANGNWDGVIINTLLSIGVFCDDRDIFDHGIEHYLRGRGNGGITKYIFPSGQCQESTRDQSHTQLVLREFALACRVAWNQGIDLYSVADNRLALGFEYTARYLLDEDVSAYGPISEQRRNRLSDIYEGVYQHYHHLMGQEMPYVGRAVQKARGRRRAWSALTMYVGPIAGPAGTLTKHPPKPGRWAAQAGALDGHSAAHPLSAIHVGPGEAIQAALDSSVTHGGWVVLEKGIHTLPTSLRVPSGVTLSGQGLETVLFLDPEAADRAGVAIVNADTDLHDVTFRDFVIEGATETEHPDDPNQRRRVRATQQARRRAGIVLAAQNPGQMKNLRFEHITVRNCSRDGIAIFGAQNVNIVACDISDNGGSVVPGPGIQHNLLLSGITRGRVTNTRMDTSPWGCGLDVSRSNDIVVINCEAARNGLHGIRVSESENIRLSRNLFEGNDGSGIVLPVLMDGSRRIRMTDNIVRNNAGAGLDIAEGIETERRNNILTDNRRGTPAKAPSSMFLKP